MKLKQKILIHRRQRGSSSVLVIMIMLMLITFGVLSLMSSYSNLKIARKNAQWVQDYYALESIAVQQFNALKERIDLLEEINEKSLELILKDPVLPNKPLAASIHFTDGGYFVEYSLEDESIQRRFFTRLLVSLDGSLDVKAWKEVPQIFEYDNSIDFIDIGG